MSTSSTQSPPISERAPRRTIAFKPEPELARRLDITAAVRGTTAPALIGEILERELPKYPDLSGPMEGAA